VDVATTQVQVLRGRQVPLGGIRAMYVRRTLPHRNRSFVGAWCFVDHYGPNDIDPQSGGGMDLPPHPHTGLQTVSWLFDGELEHRDSGGADGLIRPGEVNLMTSGAGIAHSEVTTSGTTRLHGVQLWVALPDSARATRRDFEHHAPAPVELRGVGSARVFVGELAGIDRSPVQTFTPLLGAELTLHPGAAVALTVDPAYEHGALLDTGEVSVEDVPIAPGDLACVDAGPERLRLRAGSAGARLLLLGGEPFDEEIVMWWNFVGRSHDEIVAYRQGWEAGSIRFGTVKGYAGPVARIPAPPLPAVRLRPRGRRGPAGADGPVVVDEVDEVAEVDRG